MTGKELSHIYIRVPKSPSHLGCHIKLSEFPVLSSRSLLVTDFQYSNANTYVFENLSWQQMTWKLVFNWFSSFLPHRPREEFPDPECTSSQWLPGPQWSAIPHVLRQEVYHQDHHEWRCGRNAQHPEEIPPGNVSLFLFETLRWSTFVMNYHQGPRFKYIVRSWREHIWRKNSL